MTTDMHFGESLDEIRMVIQASPEAVVIVGERGLIKQVNGRAAEMFGYLPAELEGKSVDLLLPERFRQGHVGQRAHYMDHPSERRLGEGRDLVGIRKDGTEFPAEIGLIPIFFGERRNVLATITDITVRKQAENLIRLARDKTEAVPHCQEPGFRQSGQ